MGLIKLLTGIGMWLIRRYSDKSHSSRANRSEVEGHSRSELSTGLIESSEYGLDTRGKIGRGRRIGVGRVVRCF